VDDTAIMQQVQRGQFTLFEELVRRYRGALRRVAESKLGDRSLAEDAVQETFLAVFAGRQSFDPRFSFRTWLWTILLNRCRKRLKRDAWRRRETPLSVCGECEWSEVADPAAEQAGLERLLVAEQHERLHAMLEELPEVQADALRLRFFGGLKFQEIADAMESSLGGAKLRVRQGLTALAELLQRDDSDADVEDASHDV
jgi:RNA polymerase sigma-70 factor (ECF subfamily)